MRNFVTLISLPLAALAAGCAKTDPVDEDAIAPGTEIAGNIAATGVAAPANAAAAPTAQGSEQPIGDLEWSLDEQEQSALFGPPGSPAFSIQCQKPKEGEAQLIFVRHIPPGTGNVATLSFTGNGQVASVPVSPVGNPGGLGGHWRAAVSPDDNARAVSETFDGVGPVEVSVSGTPPLILPATDAPRQILASCLQG